MPSAEADVAFGSGRFNLPTEQVRQRVQESLEAVGMAEYAQVNPISMPVSLDRKFGPF